MQLFLREIIRKKLYSMRHEETLLKNMTVSCNVLLSLLLNTALPPLSAERFRSSVVVTRIVVMDLATVKSRKNKALEQGLDVLKRIIIMTLAKGLAGLL